MDLKDLYFFSKEINILEKYDLPHNFFTSPQNINIDNDVYLEEIIFLLSRHTLKFPLNDSSDLIEFIENKDSETMRQRYDDIDHNEKRPKLIVPYLNKNTNTNDILLKVLCFLKAYASSTYTNKGSFKEYFKDVFDVFYKL
jgi:hypothetical protein